jgi:hypothetical protein
LASWNDTGNSTTGFGTVTVLNMDGDEIFIATITSATNGTGYWKYGITILVNSSIPNTESVVVSFSATGDSGTSGSSGSSGTSSNGTSGSSGSSGNSGTSGSSGNSGTSGSSGTSSNGTSGSSGSSGNSGTSGSSGNSGTSGSSGTSSNGTSGSSGSSGNSGTSGSSGTSSNGTSGSSGSSGTSSNGTSGSSGNSGTSGSSGTSSGGGGGDTFWTQICSHNFKTGRIDAGSGIWMGNTNNGWDDCDWNYTSSFLGNASLAATATEQGLYSVKIPYIATWELKSVRQWRFCATINASYSPRNTITGRIYWGIGNCFDTISSTLLTVGNSEWSIAGGRYSDCWSYLLNGSSIEDELGPCDSFYFGFEYSDGDDADIEFRVTYRADIEMQGL